MKFKYKVNRIEHRKMLMAKEGVGDVMTDVLLVKATPVDAPAGDLLLALPDAEIVWHPEVVEDVPGQRGVKRVALEKETEILSAKHKEQTFTRGDNLIVDVTIGPPDAA